MAKEIDGFTKIAAAAANTRLALVIGYKQIESVLERLPAMTEEQIFRALVEVLDTLDEPRTGDHMPSAHSLYGKSMREERARKNAETNRAWEIRNRAPEKKLSMEIREWAAENGYRISTGGPIPKHIREAFHRANNLDDIMKEEESA